MTDYKNRLPEERFITSSCIILPERRVADALLLAGGTMHIKDISEETLLTKEEVGKSIGPILSNGWATKNAGCLTLTKEGEKVAKDNGLTDEEFLLSVLRLATSTEKGMETKELENIFMVRNALRRMCVEDKEAYNAAIQNAQKRKVR